MPTHSDKTRTDRNRTVHADAAGHDHSPIWLFAAVALTMTAFAANSILNRIGVADLGMAPMDFAAIRVASGALVLWGLAVGRQTRRPPLWAPRRLAGAAMLAVYMIGFSWAYTGLGAGLGALILFGVLQVVIFGWTVREGQAIPRMRWIGALIAFLGLIILLWPTGRASVPFAEVLAMVAAGAGWAVYTLLGRTETDALGATAGNFLLCVPLTGLASVAGLAGLPMAPDGDSALSGPGVLTAATAGAVTSGLGYALWYRILPALPATVAGIAQLSVPVIAVAAGTVLLDEALTARLLIAGALVLGGIAVSLIVRRPASPRN
ncbi:DMT family transporter [Eilatimonas milleporae]|uniref:Threonine/homoserine efflux transporter RhtA n=1 Tax=Eilatimonas milleporae TaxID=911205 RepID=A0A3M0CIZ8_9PROT|nr:DMT family transporter [Eilatimonas milleporae]RMB08747.1 threonine/homoserine efflux transporter RhtA [Eilatimonas milleporae]